jgi:predicted nuclease of predicted toxin-antitoxin system
MKFLLDENVEYRLAIFLKKQRYDVTAIARDYPSALTDREVLAIAVQEQRILITNDRTDFRKLIFEKPFPITALSLYTSMMMTSKPRKSD